MSTRLLVTGDTHLGYRQYDSTQREEDFADAFEQVIDTALGNGHPRVSEPVDAVIHLGDLFDDRSPSTNTIERCLDIIDKLDDEGVPFYGIIGNHERKRDTDWLEIMKRLNTTTDLLSREPTLVGDDVALYGIHAVPKNRWESADFSLTPTEDRISIVGMHQLFHPPIPNPMAAEYELQDVLPRFNMDVDMVALGDYHNHESAIVDGVQVFYPGATERTTKSQEAGSAAIVEVDPEGQQVIDRETIWLDGRQFTTSTLTISETDDLEYIKTRLDDLEIEDAVVILNLQGEAIPVSKAQIRTHLYNRGATVVRIEDDRMAVSVTDIEEGDFTSPNSTEALAEAFDNLTLSKDTEEIVSIVQEVDSVPKSAVEDETKGELVEAFKEEFDDINESDFE